MSDSLDRTFILLSTQRAGTHFVKDLLAANEGLLCSVELLWKPEPLREATGPFAGVTHEDGPFWDWYINRIREAPEEALPDRRIPLFLEYLGKLESRFPAQRLVHDLKYNTIRSLGDYIDTEAVSWRFASSVFPSTAGILHLVRRNTLALHASRLLAAGSGIWHDFGDTRRVPGEKRRERRIEMNTAGLQRSLEAMERDTLAYDQAARAQAKCATVAYEDLDAAVRGNAALQTKLESQLGDLFGIPISLSLPRFAEFRKLSPRQLEESICNWPEVAHTLRGTRFEWMLAPEQPPLSTTARPGLS